MSCSKHAVFQRTARETLSIDLKHNFKALNMWIQPNSPLRVCVCLGGWWLSSLFLLTCQASQPLEAPHRHPAGHDDQVELLAVTEIPGNQSDLSGLTGELQPLFQNQDEPTTEAFPKNLFGGISAMAHVADNRFLLVADRGPLDGAVNWPCRVHEIELSLPDRTETSTERQSCDWKLMNTTLLKGKRGKPLTGLATAFTATEDLTQRFDPEGIRVGDDGSLFVSDEYGPRLIQFNRDGKFRQEFPVPKHLKIKSPAATKAEENAANKAGRQGNRGMEGLAILPGGRGLIGIMQSPLLQDSEPNLVGKPTGYNIRIQRFAPAGRFLGEWVYQLDNTANKVNEILSVDENNFIVIERDGEAGVDAKFKKIMLINTSVASTIDAEANLPPTDLPKEVVPVKKTVLIDLLAPQHGLLGKQMPEKIEGLAFGGTLPDGRRLLHVISDNDFVTASPTCVYTFAVPPQRLNLQP